MPGAVIPAKVRWVEEQPVGTRIALNAPGAGPQTFACTLTAVGGSNDEDISLQLDFLPDNPFQPGTQIMLAVITKGPLAQRPSSTRKVIAYGETQ